MKYHVLGSGQLEAATPLEVAEGLRQLGMAWNPTVGIEDFMEGMAERCQIQRGAVVRTDSVENFVADLVQHGFLTPVIPVILGPDPDVPRPAENALLADLIRVVPAGTQWFISSDSWDDIPALLAFAREPTASEGEWLFRISEENRPRLRQAIVQHELADKIVHTTMLSATGDHLFHAYDRLMMIIVDQRLGITPDLHRAYPSLVIDEQ